MKTEIMVALKIKAGLKLNKALFVKFNYYYLFIFFLYAARQ